MDNRDIVLLLESAVSLMDLHDYDSRKSKSYSHAIFNLERIDKKLAEMDKGEILGINGVGAGIQSAISEIINTGKLGLLDELHEKTPEGILELLKIRGVGAAKVKTAWHELNIQSPSQMLEKIEAGELSQLKGFGEKTILNLRDALLFYAENKSKLLLSEALEIGERLINDLKLQLPDSDIAAVGHLRLKRPVIERISLLVATTSEALKESLGKLPAIEIDPKISGPLTFRGKYENAAIELFLCNPEEYELRKFLETGSEKHFSQMKEKGVIISQLEGKGFSENTLYEKLGVPLIIPPSREGYSEWSVAADKLITDADLRGVLHCHSTYSDGRNSLREMAEASRDMGYDYFGICDHSKSAFFYANGMFENRVLDQFNEIDELNKEFAPFRIFKGIESDILPNGDLDYDLEFLQKFDFVVASVHSVLNMDIEKATQRIIRAIENPYTTILGHLTGRVLLQRKGYPLDHKLIIDHCIKHQVIIEINAHPSRLDLDWTWVHYALEKGLMLSINPDAHSIEGMELMKYGVWMGQKGGLVRGSTLNAMSVDEITSYFEKRKAGKSK